jgi:peptide/nickel transport system substrate-binding protein
MLELWPDGPGVLGHEGVAMISRAGGSIARAGLLAVGVLAGIGSAAAQDGGTIVLVDLFAPRAGFALETDDAQVLTKAGCLEMLTRIDFDGTVGPGLATAWTQTTPTSWDFTLRANVRFADGRPVDAAAVASALNRTLHVAAPARAFSPKMVSEVGVVDAGTVRITTPAPSSLVPLRMASPNTGILSPGAFQGERINPVRACTGPFTVIEDVPRQMLRLERNPDYWGGAAGYARAELRYVPDGQVRATMVQTGQAQIATVLPVSVLRQPPATVKVLTTALPRTTALYLNLSRPPFDDVRVRQAVQAAVDTAAIAGSVFEGLAAPAVGPFAPGEPWSPQGARPVVQDLPRARALLAAAGVAPGSLKMELLAYPERPELPDVASVLQAELGEIGISVVVRVASYAALEPDLLAGRFGGMLLSRSHLTDVADPGGFLTADYACKGGYNLTRYCDPATDVRIDAALAMADPVKRFAVYGEVAAQLQLQAVSVFLVHEQQRDAVGARVRNYRIHPLGHYILTRDLAQAM